MVLLDRAAVRIISLLSSNFAQLSSKSNKEYVIRIYGTVENTTVVLQLINSLYLDICPI